MSEVCRLERSEDIACLQLLGVWRLQHLVVLADALQALGLRGEAALVVDGSGLEALDTAAAQVLLDHLALAGLGQAVLTFQAFQDRHRRIIELVGERLSSARLAPPTPRPSLLAELGAGTVGLWRLVSGHLGFLGLVMVELGRLLRRPSLLRPRELASQLQQVCLSAIPVVALVTFLIGTIVAYLLGQQAEQFGANIFVVDGVVLGMVREFSPIIVATIVAGRSGAAYTAQLGTMKLTQEIDAIRTIGLSGEQVLVVPRVIALIVALPLLVFVGDAAGVAGAMAVADLKLGITPNTFLERMVSALSIRHYVIGLAKAPIFALFIAVIGCRMGLDVDRDTRAIGASTTSTVVQCIVVVILLDALFAVLLQEMGL